MKLRTMCRLHHKMQDMFGFLIKKLGKVQVGQ